MTIQTKDREQKRLTKVAQEYRQKGYEVFVEPGPERLPDFLQSLRPDMIARKGDHGVVVEVKTRESVIGSDEIRQLTEAVAVQPSWELRLVVTNPRKAECATLGEKLDSFSPQEITNLLTKTDRLLTLHEQEGALLLLTAAIEAAIRLVAEREAKDETEEENR